MIRRTLVTVGLCAIAAGAFWRIHAQSAPAFTAAQSDAGRSAYSENCSYCHGANLDDAAVLADHGARVAVVADHGAAAVVAAIAAVVAIPVGERDAAEEGERQEGER